MYILSLSLHTHSAHTLSSDGSVRASLCFTYFVSSDAYSRPTSYGLNKLESNCKGNNPPTPDSTKRMKKWMASWGDGVFHCPDRMAPQWVAGPSSPVKSDRHPIVSTLQHGWGLRVAVAATQVGTW